MLVNLFSYPAIFKRANKEDGYVITFRDVPEAITQAESFKDCFIEAADCLDEAIAGRIGDGIDIPKPSNKRSYEHVISVINATPK